jgi:hypothetical protein
MHRPNRLSTVDLAAGRIGRASLARVAKMGLALLCLGRAGCSL